MTFKQILRRLRAVAGSATVLLLLVCTWLAPSSGYAMSCSTNDGWTCNGSTQNQFASGFTTVLGTIANGGSYGGFGGFGGEGSTSTNCHTLNGGANRAKKTPVIFIHGNGDSAISWDFPPAPVNPDYKPLSVYQRLKTSPTIFIGSDAESVYTDCELFGVTYLNATERTTPEKNLHTDAKRQIIANFIKAVKQYTGFNQVDIVSHSLGVSMAISTLTKNTNNVGWSSVRKFVNISGGIRGLRLCDQINDSLVNSSNQYPTCNNLEKSDDYGHGPDAFGFGPTSKPYSFNWTNEWTGLADGTDVATAKFMRAAPSKQAPNTSFYTIAAGEHDQIGCNSYLYAGLATYSIKCDKYAKFESSNNVKSQLDVGAGTLPSSWDWTFSINTGWQAVYKTKGGDDLDWRGVGHFKSRNNTAGIIKKMLTTDCTGLSCAQSICRKFPGFPVGTVIEVCLPNYYEMEGQKYPYGESDGANKETAPVRLY